VHTKGRAGWWSVLVLTLSACSGASGPPTVSAEARQNVMVIDEGFDLSAPELAGKVIASYGVQCPETPDDSDPGQLDPGAAPATFEERKQQYLAQLAAPRPSCHLVADAIAPKPAPLAAIAAYRSRWNAMLRGQKYANDVFTYDEWQTIEAALDVEFQDFAYHGTATAGVVAHANGGVRLVLVERQLGAPGSWGESFTCLVQSDIDQSTALLVDPEVRAAYLVAPASAYRDEFNAIVSQYNVGVVNESFGGPPRIVLEQLQLAKGCPNAVSLAAYFAAANELSHAWDTAHGAVPPYVWTQSAGNDGVQLDSANDSGNCTGPDQRHLLVGSTDLIGARSAFSDFGACVDVYAPGENVIAPYAGGWIFPLNGTSFAAPLTARLVSLTPISPYEAGAAWQRVIDQRDATRTIATSKFPRDFFYAPSGFTAASTAALTSGPTIAQPASVGARPDLNGARDLRRIDWYQPTLWPLRALLRERTRGAQ